MGPAMKRRKVDHVSDEDDDASSFASFGTTEPNATGLDDLDNTSDSRDGSASDDSDNDGIEVDAGDDSDEHVDMEELDGEDSFDDGDDASEAEDATEVSAPPAKHVPEPKTKKAVNGRVPASALTGGNVKANLFQMQVEDLLSHSRPVRNSRAEAAEKALRDLKSIMDKLSPRSPTPIVAAERDLIKKSRVAIPFPDPRPPQDAQYKLEFQKPASINVVGSYASNLYLRSNKLLEVDMMVQIPDALFQPKDYQDFRYFYRRSYYLACLAAGIRDASQSKYVVEFCNHQGNPLRPILTIKPADASSGSASKWQINILPCISLKVFANEKLVPSKSLVRDSSKDAESQGAATSFYNSSIQADRQMTNYLKLIHSASSSSDDFKDAALLLRIWLRQRGFSSAVQGGGFGNFEVTALLAALIVTGSVSARYSTYQLFKAALQFLASKDALKSSVMVGQSAIKPEHLADSVFLLDGQRNHNLAYKTTIWSYKTLRAEARNTIAMLGDNSSEQFEPTFVLKEDLLHLKYDMSVELPNHFLSDQVKNDHEALQLHHKLHKTLARGLGDRVTQINLKSDSPTSWELGSARPTWKAKGNTTVSLRLNPANAGRAVDHGPSAEQKQEAAEFRKFWGQRAELRRFKDGSILESVVWPVDESDQALITEIITYVVSRHFGDSTAAALQPLGNDVSKLIPYSGGLAAFQPAIEAFKTLEGDIRSLEGLPLTIRQIFPTDEQTRYASIQLPSPTAPIDVVLQFESSTRWPNSLTAIQRTKAAFLLFMSRLIRDANPELTCRVGLENSKTPVLNQSFLEIQYPRFTFHLRLHHDLELSFLQSQLKSPQLPPPQREATALALSSYKRTFLLHPSHTTYITKLSTTYPALSPTIRLLKHWFSSHLLNSHFPPALIELLALRPFLTPHPYPVPSSPQTGFLRSLAFLANWAWDTTPLLLPPSSSTDRDAFFQSARTRFTAWRKLDPALNRVVLFVAYPADPEGTGWSDTAQGGPGRVVAGRMTSLARAAMEEAGKREMVPKRLFASGMEDYDFVIRLGDVGGGKGKRGKGKKGGFKNLEVQEEGEAGEDAVAWFLEEVKGCFGGAVVLFYGGKGGRVVGGLWNPVTEERAWKVGLGYSSVVGHEGVARVNKEGILGEIARLGGELVEKIEVKKS